MQKAFKQCCLSAFLLGTFSISLTFFPPYFAVLLGLGNYESDATTDKMWEVSQHNASQTFSVRVNILEVVSKDSDSESFEQALRFYIWKFPGDALLLSEEQSLITKLL